MRPGTRARPSFTEEFSDPEDLTTSQWEKVFATGKVYVLAANVDWVSLEMSTA